MSGVYWRKGVAFSSTTSLMYLSQCHLMHFWIPSGSEATSTLRRMVLINNFKQMWICRPALLNHARLNQTQPESSRYGSKEVDARPVVWTCWSVLFNFSGCVYSIILFKIILCLHLWWIQVTEDNGAVTPIKKTFTSPKRPQKKVNSTSAVNMPIIVETLNLLITI